MIVGPKVVAVDDNEDHLLTLSLSFDNLGGLCKAIDYAVALDREIPLPTGVRILFMDINLLPGGAANEGARTFAPIVAIIRKLIDPENGPYALVTWTDSPQSHQGLMDYVGANLDGALKPCADFCLSKGTYLEDPPALAERLASLADELPGLAMLLDWEAAVTRAADRAVFGIMGLSSEHGRGAGEAVVRAVNAIGRAAAGHEAATTLPFRAFTNGMSAVLTDRLDHAALAPEREAAWAKTLATAPQTEPDLAQRAALNGFFHLASIEGGVPPAPGVVYKLRDEQLLSYLQPRFESIEAAVRSGEFMPIKVNAFQAQGSGTAFAAQCRWRLVRLGADCDHANAKLRVFEGHIAVEVPEAVLSSTHLREKGDFRDTPAKCDWLFQAPPLVRENQVFALVINLRMRMSLSLAVEQDYEAVYRLRESLTREIADYSARFATRPGLVEFR